MAVLMPEIGNRYKAIEKLGEGGMGAVYLVVDSTTGGQVALKALLGQAEMDDAAFLGFKQEFRTMAKLRHPNTCEVYDYGRLPDGTPYFTMEVVPGVGLDEALPIAAADLPAILKQLALALGYIHQQGFVHCDIKPENVRIRPDGTVKLMDFGLMEVAGHALEAIKGTLAYLAPEVAKLESIDQRADIYSLGALTYHLLAGVPPFKQAEPEGPIAILRAHLNQTPRPLSELVAAIPAPLERVVLQMLAKEPAKRFASTYDVLAALGIEVDVAGGASLLASAFMGRRPELAKLHAALGELKAKTGNVLWLVGSAGSGKSRLLGEFRFAVQLEEVPYLQGNCAEHGVPYGPFVEILRGLLPLAKQVCPGVLSEHGPLLAKLLPELADGRPAPSFEPKEEKTLLQAALVDLILKTTAESGGVLALENWDRADALSRETLIYLCRNASSMPLLIIGTSRSSEVTQGLVLALDTLNPEDSAALVQSMLGVKQIPFGLAAQMHQLTGGNPQFLGNLLEHLIRIGSLTKSKGQWHLPDAISPKDLPGDVKDLLVGRLATLSPFGLRVAEMAAVYGQPFGAGVAAAILGIPDEKLFDALDEAAQAKVLTTLENRHYVFADAALRQALYDRMDADERKSLHHELASYLEARLPNPAASSLADITILAQHLLAANPEPQSPIAARTIRYALDAGSRNLDLFALDTAKRLLEAGLGLLKSRAPSQELDAVHCDYLNLLATLYHWTFDLEKANLQLLEGIPLAERCGDKPRLLEMLVTQAKNAALSGTNLRVMEAIKLFERAADLALELGNQRTLVRAQVNLGRCLFFNGQHIRAREVFQTATERAREAGLDSWFASSLCFLGYLEVTASGATREQGFARIAEAIAIQERIGDKGGLEYSYNLLFEVQLQAGRLAEADISARRNTELAKELGIQDDYVIGLLNQAIVALEMGKLDRALEVGQACEQVATELAHRVALPIVRAVLALATLHRGQYAKGLEQLRAAEALGRETSNYVYSIVIPFVVEGWLLLGQSQEALNAAQEALFLLRSVDDPNAQVRLWNYLAEIHGRLGQEEIAKDFAERAITAALETDAKGSLTRALRSKAWLIRKNQAPEARKLAEQALGLASVIQSDLLTTQISAMLGELALTSGSSDAFSHFQATQALGDQMGAPLYRAIGLYGQCQANPLAEQATSMLVEAQKILRGLGQDLEPELLKAFQMQPEVQRVLEKIPGVLEDPLASAEASQLTMERLQRVGFDLQNVASQYGVLFKEWNAKSGQLEMLNDLARQVNETLQIDAVLVQVSRLTLELTKAERCFLLLRAQDDPQKLVCEAAYNQFGRAIPHERSSMSICHRVLASGQSLAIMDATANSEFQASKSIASLNLRTLMCVPMQAQGQTIGVLYVDSQAVVTTFTDKDLELLRAIAAHASVAIENAKLYSALNRRAAELERALELYRKADYEASTDMLTGLRNRRYFQEQAAREFDISRRYERHMSLLMVDIDQFKKFNDVYGQAVGDEVLKAVGMVLIRECRTCDLPSRMGGEEFVVLCPDTDANGAQIVAERIRQAVMDLRLTDPDGRAVGNITASLGVAGIMQSDADLPAVLERLEAALYTSKAGGRNQVQLWRAGLVGEVARPKA